MSVGNTNQDVPPHLPVAAGYEPFPQEKPVVPARITVSETIYHSSPDQPTPSMAEGKYGYPLTTYDMPYTRRFKLPAAKGWAKLDLGYLAESGVSMVHLANVTGTLRQVIPTKEEQAEEDRVVVQMGIQDFSAPGVPSGTVLPFSDVRPKRTTRIMAPPDPTTLMVRCLHGDATVQITIVPA